MTVLAWLGHALEATAWFVFHLVVASGLYLLSANLATQPGAEAGVLSFEVLLRASEAARSQAQARGAGLPRFTIAAAHVSGKDTRLHLRCDGDATHEYVVRSVDGLVTFTPR